MMNLLFHDPLLFPVSLCLAGEGGGTMKMQMNCCFKILCSPLRNLSGLCGIILTANRAK